MAWNGRHVDILIAMPSGGQVYLDWALDFARLWKQAPPNTFVAMAPEPQIDVAREKLANMALSMNAKYIFWLDTDILCPPDTIQRLMKHKKPFVSGLYARRYHPCFNEMMRKAKDDKGNDGYMSIPEGAYEKGSLVECDAVGFGCVLMETSMLKEIEQPWFKWTEGPHGAIRGQSEDFYMCSKARRAGFKIFCDTSIVARHMGPVRILPSVGAQGLFEFKQSGPLSDL
jgi:GT2 family glycosyltransferase